MTKADKRALANLRWPTAGFSGQCSDLGSPLV